MIGKNCTIALNLEPSCALRHSKSDPLLDTSDALDVCLKLRRHRRALGRHNRRSAFRARVAPHRLLPPDRATRHAAVPVSHQS